MKVCIIGDGLVSLTLANVLIQKNLSVDIIFNKNIKKHDKSRTIGISKSNINYFNKEVVNIDKFLWNIKNIKIYTENFSNEEVLNFSNNETCIFSIIKNYQLYDVLRRKLKKSKIIKFRKNKNLETILKRNYNLIINCDPKNEITKKLFSIRFQKIYNSQAYTAIIKHKKIDKNQTAIQNFTNKGPIAFLPISNTETSVVYSLRDQVLKNKLDIKKLILKFNPKYEIIKIYNCNKFELKSSNLRRYYKKNILAFGDLLHQVHPLAGQGFNMSLRDIQYLSELIDKKISIGLEIDKTICYEFQKNSKDKNLIFSTGIDLIYELFKFESKINNPLFSKSIKAIGNNKLINSFFKKFADNGLRI